MGGTPVPEGKKAKSTIAAPSIDFDSYVPWYKRRWFNRMRIAKWDYHKAEELKLLPYDALSALRWGKIAEDNAIADYRERTMPKP